MPFELPDDLPYQPADDSSRISPTFAGPNCARHGLAIRRHIPGLSMRSEQLATSKRLQPTGIAAAASRRNLNAQSARGTDNRHSFICTWRTDDAPPQSIMQQQLVEEK